uniref:Saposin B-type domain-containing protein n=1 Tax=Caenorhabditis japonica TaxID=281687 RepID=A0A8R1ILM7_CAEJA
MLCTVITEPVNEKMAPTAMVNAMFKKCDKMGLMEPVCEQFVSENVKDIFTQIRRGIPTETVCEVLRFCDD